MKLRKLSLWINLRIMPLLKMLTDIFNITNLTVSCDGAVYLDLYSSLPHSITL